MPGHVKAALTDTAIAIPVRAGVLAFGTWQALYLIEHRNGVGHRTVELHYVGS